jgi:ATP-dependent Lhr-like helicase
VSLASFHPVVRRWFEATLGEPTAAQREGWPPIRQGRHTLIAAPTGSGKTLAAFLSALDGLLAHGGPLPNETSVLYLSPLKALASDVQKNLERPLEALRALDPSLPEVRVTVRTGDTGQRARASMVKSPPHILVTTPESLYILLTSDGGRGVLRTVKTVIVDEIHALARDKRGAHLALSLERLDALVGRPIQRIGLSATQKPLSAVAEFLVGKGRDCALVDTGHLRRIDLAIEVPPSPLAAVCSHEQWEEIDARVTDLVREHRTTLVFVNTRKMAERVAARLGGLLGPDDVTCHHGSLSAARRHDAESRLKDGKLRALVATASLELGIDIGDVDLVIQLGSCRSIATLLQRVGRAGHGVGRVPKGRLFPLTRDELVEAHAIVGCIANGELDRTPQPSSPLDILAQQIVAACVPEAWDEDGLFEVMTRAFPYRALSRADFDRVLALHAEGRWALLHRMTKGAHGSPATVRATRRARLTALAGGGAIPDNADYRVVMEPTGTFIGTLNEDFAIESNGGDIFQLGTASWRILKVEPGVVRVADAQGAPPTIPFWLGEAPARTSELSAAVATARSVAATTKADVRDPVLGQLAEYVEAGVKALGVAPTQSEVVAERFFDESGGMQLVLHAPFGGRINRAWGLALRKRFCRGFGFELQAAANEEAILFSLGPQNSFALEEVFDFLHPATARDILVQALLQAPMFKTRWRWNVTRSLMLERVRGGKRIAAPLLRMRADDLLAASFPAAVACPETLPGGDLEVPMDHPIVRQTVDDCLHEAMDVDGFLAVLRGLRDGSIRRHAVDTPEPSAFAHGILAAQPYAFLDDAPLEERRTQAVLSRRTASVTSANDLGALDPDAIDRVRREAWPEPSSADEMHEALLWIGFVTTREARESPSGSWVGWLSELRAKGLAVEDGERWFAAQASRDPLVVLRGRMEALGPVVSDDPLMLALEAEGSVLRGSFEGRPGWCNRRLLARIHRYTLERLRKEIEPVTASDFLRFLAAHQHVGDEYRVEGPRGVADVVRMLAGFEVPAVAWEASVLPARVNGYKRAWLDHLTLGGEIVWGRLWGSAATTVRNTPMCLLPREDLEAWTSIAAPSAADALGPAATRIHASLATDGALFPDELRRRSGVTREEFDEGIGALVAAGVATCDHFGSLRGLIFPRARRRMADAATNGLFAGRWGLFRSTSTTRGGDARALSAEDVERVAKQLLRRTGVVFRKVITRERIPVPWRDLVRAYRTLEARGDVRGGRFVEGFDGEQYALPESVALLRSIRKRAPGVATLVSAADPLNLRGILTPDARVAPTARLKVEAG